MASMSEIVQSMMEEFGKSSVAVRKKVERLAGEAAIELLNQNDGQFIGLKKTQDITLAASVKTSRLPSDFNTSSKIFTEVNSSGDFIAERAIVTDQEYYRRKGDTNYGGTGYAMIETKQVSGSNPGDYLTWDGTSTSIRYFKFFYYRKARASDIFLITVDAIPKRYIRGNFPEYVPEAATALMAYYSSMKQVIENPQARVKNMIMMPSKHIQKRNRFYRKIGGGR